MIWLLTALAPQNVGAGAIGSGAIRIQRIQSIPEGLRLQHHPMLHG
jgi:hypothetical protein